MKYFNDITSFSELKKQFRNLVLANHPDKGGSTETMQEINSEFDVLYTIWQNVPDEKQQDSEKTESAKEYRRNFYTQYGWEGSRYDNNLSLKEIAVRVRMYAKECCPQYKFSVSTQYFSGGCSLKIRLVSGPEKPFIKGSQQEELGYISTISSVRDYPGITEIVLNVMNDVCDYAQSFNYNDSDGMIDYFDVRFYLHIYIGDWDKPYELKACKEERIKESGKSVSATDEGMRDQEEAPAASSIAGNYEVVAYSEKSIAVFGDTKQIKDALRAMGGRFNKFLKYGESKRAGWVFPASKRADVDRLLYPEAIHIDPAMEQATPPEETKSDDRQQMNDGAFMAFVSCIQKRMINAGYQAARSYVKEKIERYIIRLDQLRYIAFVLADFRQRI